LEFGGLAASETREPAEAEVLEFQRGESAPGIPAAGLTSLDREMPVLDSVPLEKQGGEKWMPTPTPVEAGELPLTSEAVPPGPVEIILEASRPGAQEASPEASPLVFPLAPLGRRFLAGLTDALILLLATGLFVLILWRAGVHVSPQPLNFVVLGCIVFFFLLVYFGLFTALASATPGLLWMGIEVRNLDGNFPSRHEAFWRAVGYLVSISALMMGFIWALVDSEGLTWHDRISGTFLTLAQSAGEGQTSEVGSMNF
jgi:uncharacterized RDD family membrane protein YckC